MVKNCEKKIYRNKPKTAMSHPAPVPNSPAPLPYSGLYPIQKRQMHHLLTEEETFCFCQEHEKILYQYRYNTFFSSRPTSSREKRPNSIKLDFLIIKKECR
jgi:hypothetical protein